MSAFYAYYYYSYFIDAPDYSKLPRGAYFKRKKLEDKIFSRLHKDLFWQLEMAKKNSKKTPYNRYHIF